MNQFNFDKKINNNSSGQLLKESTYFFLVGFGAFIAVIFTSISCLIIGLALQGDKQTIKTTEALYYLIPIIAWLLIYSTLTTKVASNKVSYKIRHIIKRFLDIIFSSMAIFFLSPLIILLAVMIKLDSEGPILYRSIRIGQFGRKFDICRFRTEHIDSLGKSTTRIGKFLIRFSLNELPLFYNVLEGELSLVGPWFWQPHILESFSDAEKQCILSFRPGITGLWQISDSQKLNLRQAVALELEYVKKWSLPLDLQILLKTMWITLFNPYKN